MVKEMFRKALKYYSWAHKAKRTQSLRSINLAWRASAIILIALAIFLVYDYLQGKYPEAVSYTQLATGTTQVIILGDKLFTWFLIGVFFGIIALSVINEGEYFLAVRRVAQEIEREAEQAVKGLQKQVEKETRLLVPKTLTKQSKKNEKTKKRKAEK